MTVRGREPRPEFPPRQALPKSPKAEQLLSELSLLKTFFLVLEWFFTTSFSEGNFTKWGQKKLLAENLSQQIVTYKEKESNPKEAKELQQSVSTVLKSLSGDELTALQILIEEKPLALWFITQSALKNLPTNLKELATPRGREVIALLEQAFEQNKYVKGSELLTYGQNLLWGATLMPLFTFDISNGYLSNKMLYEIHPLFPMPPDNMVIQGQAPVEVFITDPTTQRTYRYLHHLEVDEKTTGAHIKQKLQDFEKDLNTPQRAQEFENKLKQVPQIPDEVLMDPKKAKELEFKHFSAGQIYQVTPLKRLQKGAITPVTRLSLLPFLSYENVSNGMIVDDDLTRTQSILSKWLQNQIISLQFFPKSGVPSYVPCHLTLALIFQKNRSYLELTFNTQVETRKMSFTTRIPFQLINDYQEETREALIDRIGIDGTLARVLLMAESAFTRQFAEKP